MWNIQNDRVMMALAMTMSDKPMAVNMSFQREYAERYEWIKQQFIDLSFTYLTSMLYYEGYDTMLPEQRQFCSRVYKPLAALPRPIGSLSWISLRLFGIFISLCWGYR